ncbi:3-isopropylmalate dehydrogenase [Thiomicrorhabdus sp. 6S2-11]|jgi:3-isopropylmalate dehydrogenase|uniref:3-isopropylmalate dehydrogenase n=1 Tax=Thiomicrorhabdus marina TaxID=2818442 RepID=A0ABS3Q5K1_9GAMM|nr:3-isopropylmalate dehydrogenase [Thiomicrorhabdus marina]MBO1927438.1 3-isopropylmalate dehydrogenase [Thiomicrorhabdus marina]
MTKNVLILPGDGIGPEITAEAVKVLNKLVETDGLDIAMEEDLVGGAAYDVHGVPLADETMQKAHDADAVLLGAVGGYKWESLDISVRPEKGLLRLRKEMELFANLRPAMLFPQLASASTLKPEIVAGLDILIVRELTGGIYFGQPRGIRTLENGERQGYNTYVYSESEVKRIAHVAFQAAMKRGKKLTSVDKANVLEVTEMWREIIDEIAPEYPEVEVNHMYVDNAAMQLVLNPKQFDVMVTGNMFGDILSDEASMLTGSIGMLASASLDKNNKGMYEPSHGSAPDIAGQNKANPLATIMSAAMMLRYTLGREDLAVKIEDAISKVLDQGLRTGDIMEDGMTQVTCSEMGDAVVAAL